MTEETKRKLEEEDIRFKEEVNDLLVNYRSVKDKYVIACKKHDEKIKRIIAEKGSGWSDNDVSCYASDYHYQLKRKRIESSYCFSSESKAKEYAVKIELFLRMSKWCEENSLDPIHAICYVHALAGYITFPVAYCLPEGIDIFKKEILKVWVRGEYE